MPSTDQIRAQLATITDINKTNPKYGFSISSFRSRVPNIARSQYFLIRIPRLTSKSDVLTGLCRSTTAPQIQIATTGVYHRGREMKIAAPMAGGDWNVSFLCDEAQTLRHKIVAWIADAYDPIEGLFNQHNDYKEDNISISHLTSDAQSITSTTTLFGAFPTTVSPLVCDHANEGFITFDVTFSFDYLSMRSLDGDAISATNFIQLASDGKMDGFTNESIKSPFR